MARDARPLRTQPQLTGSPTPFDAEHEPENEHITASDVQERGLAFTLAAHAMLDVSGRTVGASSTIKAPSSALRICTA